MFKIDENRICFNDEKFCWIAKIKGDKSHYLSFSYDLICQKNIKVMFEQREDKLFLVFSIGKSNYHFILHNFAISNCSLIRKGAVFKSLANFNQQPYFTKNIYR